MAEFHFFQLRYHLMLIYFFSFSFFLLLLLFVDMLEMTYILFMEGYLLTIDVKKAFHSVNQCFVLAIPEKI